MPGGTDTPELRDLPLAGRTVVVTRAREQAAGLVEPLEALGADVIAFPVITIVDPDDWGPADRAIGDIGSYDWAILTSTNAVERFAARLAVAGLDPAAALAQVRVAAVGSSTADRLRAVGVEPALVPEDFRGEGLVDALREAGAAAGWRVLIPRALKAREVLPERLRELGCEVDVVPVYRTIPADPDHAAVERLRARGVDVVTFTSPSTLRNFMRVVEGAGLDPDAVLRSVAIATIGPVTSDAVRATGHRVAVEADPSTADALADALGRYLTSG